jgi:hypothetical protein
LTPAGISIEVQYASVYDRGYRLYRFLSRSGTHQRRPSRGGAQAAGVIHAACNHDFSNLKQNSEDDRKVIETIGEVLACATSPR